MASYVKRTVLLVVAAGLIATAAACGDDDDESSEFGSPSGLPTTAPARTPQAGGAEGATDVDVTLKEFEVTTSIDSVPTGEVAFHVQNIGPEDDHEFVIIRTDLGPDELPYMDDGSVSEDDIDVVDEVEEFPVGDTRELTVDLDAGSYVLICSLVHEEDGVTESHYRNGMATAFAVR